MCAGTASLQQFLYKRSLLIEHTAADMIFQQVSVLSQRKEQTGVHGLPQGSLRHVDIGIWGERRRRYLYKAKPTLYMQMQDNHSLTDHLISINEAADSMMEQLEAEMMEKEGVNEKLKAEDWMEWVRRANSIQSRAEEIVYNDLIYK